MMQKVRIYMKTYLAIERSRIMPSPEKREKSGVVTNSRVELDPNHFHMFSSSSTNQYIIRVVNMALRITHLCFHHTWDPLERQLYSPEAPGSELGELQTRSLRVRVVRIQSWVD